MIPDVSCSSPGTGTKMNTVATLTLRPMVVDLVKRGGEIIF